MSDFKAKMHRCSESIRCRLRLCPRPPGGAYSAPPDPLAGFKGPTSKERGEEGKGREGRGGEEKGGEGREGRREREGRGEVRGGERMGRERREVDTPNFYLDRRLCVRGCALL